MRTKKTIEISLGTKIEKSDIGRSDIIYSTQMKTFIVGDRIHRLILQKRFDDIKKYPTVVLEPSNYVFPFKTHIDEPSSGGIYPPRCLHFMCGIHDHTITRPTHRINT